MDKSRGPKSDRLPMRLLPAFTVRVVGWGLARERRLFIKTDEPCPVNKCLGCEHAPVYAVINGALQPIASSVLMKVLYAARLARFDLLKPVASLAKKVTKWDKGCD
eukprot:13670892-Heterocapsa_arctica.AAC.1